MRIGLYELGAPLGSGTVAETFLAQGSGNKVVVVKKLRPEFARDARIADRFLEACNTTSKIRMKRFLATVTMQTRIEDGVFLVREHVEGKSLDQLLRDGQLATLNARQLAFDLCDALRALHLQGIVHGGIHPGNIVVQKDSHLRLMDHGISRAHLTGRVDPDYPPQALRALAPEQWLNQTTGIAADLYAAGLIVALLTQQRELIGGKSYGQIKEQALAGVKVDNSVLAQALARDPARRFGDSESFRAALKTMFDAGSATVPARQPEPPKKSVGPPPREPSPNPVLTGSLRAMKDVKGGADLLALSQGYPWRLKRTDQVQQWPIFFTNGGPGELHLELRCRGDGIECKPTQRLRLRPGQSRYAIVTLAAQGSDFASLDVVWEGQKHSERVRIRIYRPK